ncbi:MAG: cbb3-type cytochrome oxidase assembly protein CcoS [Flavobacteriaceae bacterium]
MSIIYMLLAVSVVVAVGFFVAFIISVREGQYDDVYTPSVRMLFDDELVKEPKQTKTTNTKNQN